MQQNSTVRNDMFFPVDVARLLDGKKRFVIPSYQRGYRWEKRQVTDLLEDLKQFSNESNKDADYFLQPLVVKRLPSVSPADNGKEKWEVLDGQQRLTTLLLILRYICDYGLLPAEKAIYADKIYDITYANRPQLDFNAPKASDNIDSYYLAEAKRTIESWFTEQITEGFDVLGDFKKTLFMQRSAKHVKFIWYESSQKSETIHSIQIFNRLNKGKIGLTSSELIKALFIMDYDLQSAGSNSAVNITPGEQLAMEWNEMERTFQNNDFWHFISNKDTRIQTRIDILFDFLTGNCGDNSDDSYNAYRKFQNLYDHIRATKRGDDSVELDKFWIERDISSMQEAWALIVKTYDRMLAWYEDDMFYHYVGYLVAVGFTPLEVFEHLENEKKGNEKSPTPHPWTSDDSKNALRRLIMEKFKLGDNKYLTPADIDTLEYGSAFIFRLLLLFNVETCLTSRNIRFDFNRFKDEHWDIEHIDSQNTASLETFEDRMRWIDNVAFILDIESKSSARGIAATALLEKCRSLSEKFRKEGEIKLKLFQDLDRTVNQYFSFEEGIDADITSVNIEAKNKDNISNLTLLDSATNRGYQDAPFPYKRHCIIDSDRKGNRFIPVTTRNVFLKYYADSDKTSSYLDAMRWNSTDRECYLKAIHTTIDPIFNLIENGKRK